jgi:hypothetical protein
VSAETLVAAGYAAFLVLVALGLDRLGRHAHKRSGRYRTQGFTYRPELDLWECPEGEHLRPFAVDHRRRVARYRARPAICNSCPAKDGCTDSDEGREIQRPMDPWPHSEAGRFHRGISVALVGLAFLVSLIAIVLTPVFPDVVLLGTVIAATVTIGVHMARAFAAMPSGFPDRALAP